MSIWRHSNATYELVSCYDVVGARDEGAQFDTHHTEEGEILSKAAHVHVETLHVLVHPL